MSETTRTEAPSGIEARAGRVESDCALGQKRPDAVCDGRKVRIAFLDKVKEGDSFRAANPEEKTRQVREIQRIYQGLKRADGSPLLGHEITEVSINNTVDNIETILKEKGLVGCCINLQGEGDAKLSALAMITFLDTIANAQGDVAPERLMAEAQKNVNEVIRAYRQTNSRESEAKIHLAAALIGEDNKAAIVNDSPDQQIVFVKKDGSMENVGQTDNAARDIGEGEQMIICSSGFAKNIKERKAITDYIANLTAQPASRAASALEISAPQAVAETAEKEPATESSEATQATKEEAADIAEITQHKADFFVDGGREITTEQFKQDYQQQYQAAERLIGVARGVIPRNPGENDLDYNTRLAKALEDRLRWVGDYADKEDDVLRRTIGELRRHSGGVPLRNDLLLMALEVQRADMLAEDNARISRGEKNDTRRQERLSVKTEVVREGDVAFVEGDYDSFFEPDKILEDGGEAKLAPSRDLEAFTLFADPLLDVKDENGRTYREQMQTAKGKDLVVLRRRFYQTVIEVMKYADFPGRFDRTASEADRVRCDLVDKLNDLRTKTPQELVEMYKGVQKGLSANTARKIGEHLSGLDGEEIFNYAIKGADLMDRRILMKRKSHEVPAKVRFKKFVQGRPIDYIAGKVPAREPGSNDGNPPPEEPKAPSGVPAAEASRPSELNPAPGKKEEEPGKPSQPGEPTTPATPPQELEMSATLGVGALRNARTQNILSGVEACRSFEASQIKPGWYQRIPILGGVIHSITHPVKLIWQNALTRPVADQQKARFSSDVQVLVRKALGYDDSVPVEITTQMYYKILQEGRNIREKKGFFQKIGLNITDTFQRITGIGQTSEQRCAKQWIEAQGNNLATALGSDMVSNLLSEQTSIGEKYALAGSNREVLAQGNLESRYELPDNLRQAASDTVKGMIARYAGGAIDEKQLLRDLNTYILGALRNSLPDNMKADLNAPEVASNILSLANKVKGQWDGYQQQGENGQKKWDEFQVRILLGKAEWGAVRGKIEAGIGVNYLVEKLAQRNYGMGGQVAFGAGAMASSIGINGGAYGAGYLLGWGASVIGLGRGALARMVGGVFGTAVAGGIQEVGIDLSRFGVKGIKGRYVREIEQVSREKARGRTAEGASARVRQQIEKSGVLVEAMAASDFEKSLRTLLAKESLSDADKKALLKTLAELDARMRLTDLSGQREMRFRVQNYLRYTEGQENAEYLKLKQAFIEGMLRLSRDDPQNYGKFDQFSQLAEAQFRVSSQADQVRRYLERVQKKSASEVNALIQLLPQVELASATAEQSLARKERILQKLRAQRFASTVAISMLAAPVAGEAFKVVGAGVGEITHFISDVTHGGLRHYAGDWAQVLHGNPPVVDRAGQLQLDASPIQKGVMFLETLKMKPHPTQIDGVQINLGSGMQKGIIGGDQTKDYIVDMRSGKVYDLRDYHFAAEDITGDGKADLILVRDSDGALVNPPTVLGNSVRIVDGPQIDQRILTDTNNIIDKDVVVNGGQTIHTHVPQGTRWDAQPDGSYHLVVDGGPGNGKILIDDARFDASGKITGTSLYSEIKITNTGGTEAVKVDPTQAEAFWRGVEQAPDKTAWWTNGTRGSDYQELQFYNNVYRNTDGSYAVVLDGSHMGQASIDGQHFSQVNDLVAGVPNGMQWGFHVGGHLGFLKVDDASDGLDHQLILDPTSAREVLSDGHAVVMPDGHHLTIGELSRMVLNQDNLKGHLDGKAIGVDPGSASSLATEVQHWQDVFNLASPDKSGHIFLGFTGADNTFNHLSTIFGKGDLGGEIVKSSEPNIDLTGDIGSLVQTFTLTSTSNILGNIPLIPIYARQDVEAGVLKTTPSPAAPAATTAQTAPQVSSQPSTALTTEEREALLKRKQELEGEVEHINEAAQVKGQEPDVGEQEDIEEKEAEIAKIDTRLQEEEETISPEPQKTEQEQTQQIPIAAAEAAVKGPLHIVEAAAQKHGVNLEIIDTEESNHVMTKAEIHATPFNNGDRLSIEDLAKEGLAPKYKITIGGTTLWFSSSPYDLGDDRIAVVAYVENNKGAVVARSFYRSNSQGIWRYLPNYQLNGIGNINWYSKGHGEQSVTLPWQLQLALSAISNKEKAKKVNNSDFIFGGTARDLGYMGTFYMDVEGMPQRLESNFYSENPDNKVSPDQLVFHNPQATPNLNHEIAVWKQNSALYGPINIRVFNSQDNALTYMFCEDRQGRVWIGGIENNTEIQSVGLRKRWVDGGDLVTPAFEYHSQTGGYGNNNLSNGNYVDMFQNYLSKIPIIQEYLRIYHG